VAAVNVLLAQCLLPCRGLEKINLISPKSKIIGGNWSSEEILAGK
jgi:hypothetical protein